MVLYLRVLIVFSLHRESLKLILATNPSPRWLCHSYALVDTKSHVSKNSKVTMSRLLGGVISELVLILVNLDFEIDRS
jgi:hypothetical protein